MHNAEVVVPYWAGWRRERMPYPPEDQSFKVVPDWVCKILSPSTKRKDRKINTLETYRLEAGAWIETGRFADADQVVAPPFEAVSIELETFWAPRRPELARL